MLGTNTLAVPEGYFKSARTGKTRRDNGRHRQYTFSHSFGPDSPPNVASLPSVAAVGSPGGVGVGPSSGFVPVLPAPGSIPPVGAYGEPSVGGHPSHGHGQGHPPSSYVREHTHTSPLPQFELGVASRPRGDTAPFASVYASSLTVPSQQQQLQVQQKEEQSSSLAPPPPDRIVPSQARQGVPSVPVPMPAVGLPPYYPPAPPPTQPSSTNEGHISTQLRRERYASTPPVGSHVLRAASSSTAAATGVATAEQHGHYHHHHSHSHRHSRGYSPSSSSPGTPASSNHPPSPMFARQGPLPPPSPPPLTLPHVTPPGAANMSYTYPPPPPPPAMGPSSASASSSSSSCILPPAPACATTLGGIPPIRALVPLGHLQTAVFPRRDPTDDMLLRRFDAMRTPSSGSGSGSSSVSPNEDLHRIIDMDD